MPDKELRPSVDRVVKAFVQTNEPRRKPKKQPTRRYQSQIKYNGEVYDIKYEENERQELVGLEMNKGRKSRSRSRGKQFLSG